MNQCRYCFENIKDNKLLNPCKCKAPVHKQCFISWNLMRKSNKNKCEICNCYYNNNLYFRLYELEIQIIIKILIIIAFFYLLFLII